MSIDTTIPVSGVTYNGEVMPLASNIEVVQTTGTSETAVMSQKAVTDTLNEITNEFGSIVETLQSNDVQLNDRVIALESAGGGGSSGGVVLKTISVSSPSTWYNQLNSLINKKIKHIIVNITTGTSSKGTVSCIRYTTDLNSFNHSKTTENQSVLQANRTYLFTVTAYTSDTIILSCRDTSSTEIIDIILSVTSSKFAINYSNHRINTYAGKEDWLYGYSVSTTIFADGTIYYYDTE